MAEDSVADFEKACQDAVSVQEQLLNEILLKNTTCDYLQKHGAPLNIESFKSQVPIISYDDISQDIEQIANGSTRSILCTAPVVQFAHSSGTSSGKHKIIPQTRNAMLVNSRVFGASSAYRNKVFPMESSSPMSMNFLYSGKQHKSKSGLLIGSLTTNAYRSEAFKEGLKSDSQTSPYELIVAGSDWRQTTYCHLLCGLLKRDKVEMIHAVFAYTLCEAMRLLQTDWKHLCEDISTGTLNKKINDEKLRSIVTEELQRERESHDRVRELVKEVSGICSRESWDGIIRLLWPKTKYIFTVVTGAMRPYVPTLKKYAGDLPLVGVDYGSSEAIFGININHAFPPEKVVFTLIPYSVFFEFIPVQGDENSIVGIGEVEVGNQYELVITTSQGLYRYKVGDVVKVVSFFHEAPQVELSYRKNAVLSINTEKVDEQELQNAVQSSAADYVEIANFTSYADFETEQPAHYVIFWELKNFDDHKRHQVLKECCERLEKSFKNVRYYMGRANNTIGPLELVIVNSGTFEKLMEKAVQGGASPGQYKTPRCVTTPAMLELLKQEKVESYRSHADVMALVEAWEPSFPKTR